MVYPNAMMAYTDPILMPLIRYCRIFIVFLTFPTAYDGGLSAKGGTIPLSWTVAINPKKNLLGRKGLSPSLPCNFNYSMPMYAPFLTTTAVGTLETVPSSAQVMPVPVRPSKDSVVNQLIIAWQISALDSEPLMPAALQAA